MTEEERRHYAQQQGLQNQQWPWGSVARPNQQQPYHPSQLQQPYNPYADPRGYGPYQQPLGYSPLSEADVQRIAEAVVARLKALRAAEDRL